jgi:hypothetical protein
MVGTTHRHSYLNTCSRHKSWMIPRGRKTGQVFIVGSWALQLVNISESGGKREDGQVDSVTCLQGCTSPHTHHRRCQNSNSMEQSPS